MNIDIRELVPVYSQCKTIINGAFISQVKGPVDVCKQTMENISVFFMGRRGNVSRPDDEFLLPTWVYVPGCNPAPRIVGRSRASEWRKVPGKPRLIASCPIRYELKNFYLRSRAIRSSSNDQFRFRPTHYIAYSNSCAR